MSIKRIYHSWDKWECYKAGFFKNKNYSHLTKNECEVLFSSYFKEKGRFESGIIRVFNTWKYSCEHNLTNTSMNRVAWLGQAAVCLDLKLSSEYASGYRLLDKKTRELCDSIALKYIKEWEISR